MTDAPEAIARAQAARGLDLHGLHAHIGSQLLDLDPFRRAARELAALGRFPVLDLGGGLGVRYPAEQPEPPAVETYVAAVADAVMAAAERPPSRLLVEPGRSLTANATVTLYTRRERQAERLPLGGGGRRHVRQPAPDALRGPL